MSKLYGWFRSDRTQESTKGGNKWIMSTLQTDERRATMTVNADNQVVVTIYKMNGRNNQDKILAQTVMLADGTVSHYQPQEVA